MPILKDVALLDPRMQAGVRLYPRLCKERLALHVVVLETRRELSVQMAYYARGRAPIGLVREYFLRCGLWEITEAEAGKRSTETLYSKHILGLAVDVAPLSPAGNVWWAAPREVWLRMFEIAEGECGLDACAAGKWERWQWDWPHHEFRYEVAA